MPRVHQARVYRLNYRDVWETINRGFSWKRCYYGSANLRTFSKTKTFFRKTFWIWILGAFWKRESLFANWSKTFRPLDEQRYLWVYVSFQNTCVGRTENNRTKRIRRHVAKPLIEKIQNNTKVSKSASKCGQHLMEHPECANTYKTVKFSGLSDARARLSTSPAWTLNHCC